MKNVFIKTHGCQMNEYDSNRIFDLLNSHFKTTKVDTPENADLLILNTCSIREKAQEKVFSELGRWRKLKEKNDNILIGVAGCVASQEGEQIVKRAPFVDIVFGPQTLHRLPTLIKERENKSKAVVDVSFPQIEKFDNLPTPNADKPHAYVTVMEGCSKYCTFCIVPYTRGEEISRPFDDVIAECFELSEKGVKEITLLGQNVNAYRGKMHDGKIADLATVIEHIAEIEGVERIRFTTSHPLEFSDRIIQAYAMVPKLANHLHLPVQSGSDKILNRMKRGHSALEFKEKIFKLKKVRPNITISSDFIVGFPGETEDDFAQTLKLVEDIKFDQSYSFIYSQRPGTLAANYQDDVSLETKKQRLNILQARLTQQADEYRNAMLDTTQEVLVTSVSEDNDSALSGRTESNRIVHFAGDKSLLGQIVKVKITETLRNSLRGEL